MSVEERGPHVGGKLRMLAWNWRGYRRDVAMICDLGELPAGTVTGIKDPLGIAIP
jgi:hypothetical protein